MNNHSLSVLEFDKLREEIAGYSNIEDSQVEILEIMPYPDLNSVKKELGLVSEFMEFIKYDGGMEAAGMKNINRIARKSELIGAYLDPEEIWHIKENLKIFRLFMGKLEELDKYKNLSQKFRGVPLYKGLEELINKAIDNEKKMKDDASLELRDIRVQQKIINANIKKKFDDMFANPSYANAIQEKIVTMREGRSVIPIKADFKGQIKGIEHDRSASGQTVFIEPLTIVSLNNKMRELEVREREEIRKIQHMVNGDILANHELRIRHQPREEAIREGAMALFAETYGESVRTICIGPTCHSYELCGGTHVPSTAMIGPFLITSESSVASGIRRIEATTGRGSMEFNESRQGTIDRIADRIGAVPEELEPRLSTMLEERAKLQYDLSSLREELALEHYRRLSPESVHDVQVLAGLIPDSNADGLRKLIDQFRTEHESGVVVLASAPSGRPVIIAAVTSDLVERGLHAGDLAKAVAEEVGGSGGGKPTLAQAGGTDADGLPDALTLVPRWVESHLS